jgi:2-polyprenyl-3-methyl-5-hydroxy-6-metoxy-1,4-benzoquinol methylase
MRALVAIANHGTKNRQYLDRLLEEYRSMSYKCDIVVLSDVPKDDLGTDVEVRVGRPLAHPWSLGYAHRPLFAERRDDYDLFVYTEDDTLLSEQNLDAFLEASTVLEPNELAGFMRTEVGADGSLRYLDVLGPYRWLPETVRRRGDDTYASFSGHHSACYVLTRDQLRRAVDSGGYLVEPHAGRYDLLIAAATDPYTQCGFTKLLCISRLPDFLLPHLSNRYASEMETPPQWIPASDMDALVGALLRHRPDAWSGPLVEPESKLPRLKWSKDLYVRSDPELVAAVPRNARELLVVGSGWGIPEDALVEHGAHVVALPIDPIIGARAEQRGVELLCADMNEAPTILSGRRFDCIVFSEILHLVQNPVSVVKLFEPLLDASGSVVVSVPNLGDLNTRRRSLMGRLRRAHEPVAMPADFSYRLVHRFDRAGAHRTSTRRVRRWLRDAGFAVDAVYRSVPTRRQRYRRLPWLTDELLAEHLVVRASRAGAHPEHLGPGQ